MTNIAIKKSFDPEDDAEIIEMLPTYLPYFGLDKYDKLINLIIGNPQFENYIKEVMEKQIYSYWINKTFENGPTEDNPFDSIYLADLSPDKISKNDLQLLITLANKIEDKSDLITFNDEFEA